MNLVISKCVTGVKVSNFTGHYLRNRSTLDIGVLGFFGIVYHKEHPPELWSVPPVNTLYSVQLPVLTVSLCVRARALPFTCGTTFLSHFLILIYVSAVSSFISVCFGRRGCRWYRNLNGKTNIGNRSRACVLPRN